MTTGFTASEISNSADGIADSAPAPAAPTPAPAAAPAPAPSAQGAAAATLGAVPVDPEALPTTDPNAIVSDELAEPDPWEEKIRGELTAKQLIEKLKAADGRIPEELLDLEHEYVFGEGDDAERQTMTLREALDLGHKERLQMSTFHRELHKVREFEQTVVARAQAVQAAIQGLNNPTTLFEDLQGLGVTEENLQAAAKHYAQQRMAYLRMDPHQRALIDQNRAARQQQVKMQRDIAELRSQLEQRDDGAFKTQAQTAMRTHIAPAFKKHGLNLEHARAKEIFRFHLGQVTNGKVPTQSSIFAAAKATREELDLERRKDAAPSPGARQPAGKPLSVRSAAAPAALKVPAQANGRQRGFTVSEFEGNS